MDEMQRLVEDIQSLNEDWVRQHEFADKTGEKLSIHHDVWDGKHQYSVKNSNGHEIAHVSLHRTKPIVSSVTVRDDYRRRGIASKLYDHIEKHQKMKLRPNDALTPNGKAYWKNRTNT